MSHHFTLLAKPVSNFTKSYCKTRLTREPKITLLNPLIVTKQVRAHRMTLAAGRADRNERVAGHINLQPSLVDRYPTVCG